MASGRMTLRLKANNDTGFGTNPDNYGGRFVNRDGSFNVRKEGIPFLRRFSLYHSMLNMPVLKFFASLFAFYLVINFLFAWIYFFIGMSQFQGITASTFMGIFKEMFFFSTETFTTVGYGRVNPVGDAANSVAAAESMLGFLSFAVATGLLYGRFSKPRAFLIFSKQALMSPYREGQALMFRFVAYKDNHTLTNLDIKVNIAMQLEENGRKVYKFYDLDLERNHVETLPMNWTVVHPVNEESPLHLYTAEDMKRADVELYVSVRGFDDVYSNVVQQRTSYTFDEILFDRKFVQMYRESADGRTTILELHRLDEHREARQEIKK
ncbi:MAG: ion channel [Bacteroidota bacterium]|nr:ion channel [Bacteroidota bacterium]MDP4213564.1 ion channel [Bacteroidota bacterium]MDP4249526.1 ion channel [Bacteroidota bacterium]